LGNSAFLIIDNAPRCPSSVDSYRDNITVVFM
ncbi:hypothetical protein DBR06_SOUSAS12110051, partial [Sousa chinensis]